MRCWGRGSPQAVRGLQFERSDCEMDSRVFVSGSLLTGHLSVRHEAYDGSKLGPLRFAERYSASFHNEFVGSNDRQRTAAQCIERSLQATPEALPLKAVVCLRAYKKLTGLHDLSVLVATLDSATGGVQGRLDAAGISLANAQRLAQHYLDGFASVSYTHLDVYKRQVPLALRTAWVSCLPLKSCARCTPCLSAQALFMMATYCSFSGSTASGASSWISSVNASILRMADTPLS